jgi:hypothetical protein
MEERIDTEIIILYDFSRDTESSHREPELPGSNDGSGGGERGGAQPPRPFYPRGGGGVQSHLPFFLRSRRGGGGGGCAVTTSVGRVVLITPVKPRDKLMSSQEAESFQQCCGQDSLNPDPAFQGIRIRVRIRIQYGSTSFMPVT